MQPSSRARERSAEQSEGSLGATGMNVEQEVRLCKSSPLGALTEGTPHQPQHAVPKSENAYSTDSTAMTMEEVASDGNLRRAFQRVESNDGAPGLDRQSVREVREHHDPALGRFRDQLLIELGQQRGASDEPGVSLPLVGEVERLPRQSQLSLWRFARVRHGLRLTLPIPAPPVASHSAALSSPRAWLRRTSSCELHGPR